MQRQVIEYAGVPVGILVPDSDRMKFIAVKYHVHDLDERHFDSASDVRAAIRELLRRNEAHSYFG
nr:hypothetical protein [uncultured Gellertiella sp.]